MQAMIANSGRLARNPSPFERACFAIAYGRDKRSNPEDVLAKEENVARRIVQRANASPGSTAASGFGAELQRDAFRNYLADLAPYSGAARLIGQAIRAEVRPADAWNYPARAAGAVTAPWVGELDAIPVANLDFDLVSIGPAKKVAHLLPISRELFRRSDAERIFGQIAREIVMASLDAAFFSAAAGSTAAAAGLLYNLSSISPSGATGGEGIKADLGQLAEAVAENGSGMVTFVMAPSKLARLRVQAPEVAAIADIAPSAALPADRVIAVDPQSLLVAVDGDPAIEISEAAIIHMSSAPLEIVSDTGPTTADPARSMWQTATAALRIIHDLDFAKRRTGAVAFSDGIAWW